MNRNATLVMGLAAGVLAYGVWRALSQRSIRAMEEASDQQVTDQLEDSFPASDPPSHTPVIGSAAG